jgi:hypothetical protein
MNGWTHSAFKPVNAAMRRVAPVQRPPWHRARAGGGEAVSHVGRSSRENIRPSPVHEQKLVSNRRSDIVASVPEGRMPVVTGRAKQA